MEIDHLLSTDNSGALDVFDKDEGLAKVRFWLDTPKGQYWGNAKWGHRLDQFKHDPLDEVTEIGMENSIITELPIDIPQIEVTGINVSILAKDAINITVNSNFGLLVATI